MRAALALALALVASPAFAGLNAEEIAILDAPKRARAVADARIDIRQEIEDRKLCRELAELSLPRFGVLDECVKRLGYEVAK